MLRSYDQVNNLEALSDWPMKEHPGFVADGLIPKKKNKWQSCIGTLVIEFQRMEMLTNHFVPTYRKHGETMYQLADAVMKIISNLSRQSKDVYSAALDDI